MYLWSKLILKDFDVLQSTVTIQTLHQWLPTPQYVFKHFLKSREFRVTIFMLHYSNITPKISYIAIFGKIMRNCHCRHEINTTRRLCFAAIKLKLQRRSQLWNWECTNWDASSSRFWRDFSFKLLWNMMCGVQIICITIFTLAKKIKRTISW